MKLGDLFIELGTKGNTKELEKTLKQLKEAEKKTAAQIKLNKDLAKATTDEEKALIKKNFAQKQEIANTEKVINKSKERNKAILAGVKSFTAFVSAVSLAIGVLDRFVNASAKSQQSVQTFSQMSGISVDTINKYASAARSKNYNVTRESVAQSIATLAQNLRNQQIGDTTIAEGLGFLFNAAGGKQFDSYGMNATQFLEALRESLVGVNDEWASASLERLGISPDLLPMLRMSKSEFASVQNRFLSGAQAEEERRKAIAIQEKKDQLEAKRQELEIQLIPVLEKTVDALTRFVNWVDRRFGFQDISKLDVNTQQEVSSIRTSTSKAKEEMKKAFGKNKVMGNIAGALTDFSERIVENKIIENAQKMLESRTGRTVNVENTFNNTINTTQPADVAVLGVIEDDIRGTQYQEQLAGM